MCQENCALSNFLNACVSNLRHLAVPKFGKLPQTVIKVTSTSVKIVRTITYMESRTVLMQLSVLVHGFLKLFVFKAVNFNNRMLNFSQLQKSC
jgi:hypothetical protein